MLKYKHFCFARKKVSLLLLPILLVSIPLFFVPLTGQQPLKLDFANSINGFNASLSFSTFLGGNYHDEGFDISVSTDGCCYVAGATKSTNFPTLNAYDSIISNESDAFV